MGVFFGIKINSWRSAAHAGQAAAGGAWRARACACAWGRGRIAEEGMCCSGAGRGRGARGAGKYKECVRRACPGSEMSCERQPRRCWSSLSDSGSFAAPRNGYIASLDRGRGQRAWDEEHTPKLIEDLTRGYPRICSSSSQPPGYLAIISQGRKDPSGCQETSLGCRSWRPELAQALLVLVLVCGPRGSRQSHPARSAGQGAFASKEGPSRLLAHNSQT